MFRPAIRPLFLHIFGGAFSLFLFGVIWQDGLHPDWVALVGTTAMMPLIALLLAWVMNRLYPTHVSAEGITGYSIWGIRRLVRWADIAAARPIRILRLPYLRLDSAADRKVTWVALFAADPIGFRRAVRAAMPPDSPVEPHILTAGA